MDLFYMFVFVTMIVAQVALGVAVGWWLLERRYQRKQQERQAGVQNTVSNIQGAVNQITRDAEHHAANIEQMCDDLLDAGAADPTVSDEVRDMLAQIVENSEQFQDRLADSQQRLESHADALDIHTTVAADGELDPVTRLLTRSAFDDRLKHCFADWQKDWDALSLILCEVDQLANSTRSGQRPSADDALRAVADIVRTHWGVQGTGARFDAAHLAVALPGVELDAARRVAERMRIAVAEGQHASHPSAAPLTLSVGIASAVAEDLLTSLIRRADAALNAARQAGRNRSYYSARGQCLPVIEAGADSVETDSHAHRPEPTTSFADKRDRRSRRRAAFRGKSLVAPCTPGRLPSSDDFFEVHCHDISAGGISFLLPKPPEHQQFVITLGLGDDVSYMVVKVARTATIDVDGIPTCLVGCSFAGRVELMDTRPALAGQA